MNHVLNVKYRDSQYFKRILQAVEYFSDEATFQVSPEGLSLQMMDPGKVMLIDLNLPKAGAEDYFASGPFRFAFNVAEFVKRVLKNTVKDESVTLNVADESFEDKTKSEFEIELKSKFTRNFKVPLLE